MIRRDRQSDEAVNRSGDRVGRLRMSRTGWLLIPLLLTLPGWSALLAATYYVDASPTGCAGSACADSNNGLTEATAFATPHGCDLVMVAGDTCLIKNGNYYRNSGSPRYHQAGFAPVRSGTAAAPITYKAYPGHAPKVCSSPACTSDYANYTNPAIGTNNPDAPGGKSHIVFDGLHVVGSITLGAGVGEEASHITVQNCDITGGYTYANASCTGSGSSDGNWTGMRLEEVSDSTVRNNYFHDIGCPWPDRGHATHWFDATNVTFEYNTAYNILYGAMFLKSNPRNNTIRYNKFIYVGIDTGYPAINHSNQNGGGGNSIHHNIIVCATHAADDAGIRVHTALPNGAEEYYNNTFYNCDRGFWSYPVSTSGHSFYNNVVHVSSPQYRNDAGSSNPVFTLDHNAYYASGGASWRYGDVVRSSLADWQSYWNNQKESSSRVVDCQFVNPGLSLSSDFHVQNATCKTMGSDGGYVGALESDDACVGYGCGEPIPGGDEPPPDVGGLHRTDVTEGG